MMLDLNLDVAVSAESTQMDESVTSNSSVVNAEASSCIDGEEELCSSTRAVKFQFEILKGGEEEEEDGSDVMKKTKEFFPVAQSSVDISFQRGGADAATGAMVVMQPPAQPVKKSRRGPRSKSSQYRGVTFYRRTGRWESHIWDCGKQVYLGGFDTAHAAARAYDRAAVKFRGLEADINFIISDYEEDLKQVFDSTHVGNVTKRHECVLVLFLNLLQMANLSKEELVQVLRRQSSGFSRSNSRYQGVALQKIGGWGAQMKQLNGNMIEDGNRAYDKAVTKWSGREVASLIEPHASRMIPEAANVKLDLSLGISLSLGDGPKQKDNAPRLHHAPNSVMMENHINMATATCDTPFNLLKRGSDHLINRHVLHPSAFFSPMERTPDKGFMLPSPQSFSARTDATTAIASPL